MTFLVSRESSCDFSATSRIWSGDELSLLAKEVMIRTKTQPQEIITSGCNICGSRIGRLVANRLRFNVYRNVVKCKKCGLVYQSPLMSEEEERELYSEEYRNVPDVRGHYLPQTAREFFHVELRPNADRLVRVEKYLTPSSRCLEIGCAAGSFLHLLKKKCDDCAGIELHEAFSSFARNELGLTVLDRPIEKLGFPQASFDAIFMWHVLEHLRDPSGSLKTLLGILKRGGYLFLELPNVDDALLTLYGLKSYSGFYYQPAHSYYFSRRTMTGILEEAGFRYRIRMLQRYSILNHLNWIIRGKPQAKPAFKTHFPLSVVDQVYRTLLCALDRADTLFVIARRPF